MGKQEPTTRIGRYLQSLMDANGYESDSDLARAISDYDSSLPRFNPSLLSKWKTGEARPHLESLRRVAPLLRVRLGDLLVEAELATPAELGMKGSVAVPPASPLLDKGLKRAAGLLSDSRVSDPDKDDLRELVDEAVNYWLRRHGGPAPHEPSANDRAKGKQVTKR